MTLMNLTDANLIFRFEKLVRTERKITHLVLECIAEIDRRKLYLDKAYPSLFEYLTQVHGYSAGAAQRRISAARLLRDVPQVAARIEAGQVNLSQIALAVQTIKLAEKQFSEKMAPEAKLELLEKLKAKSFAETQQILRHELKVDTATPDRTQFHADGSITLTMTFSCEQYADWLKAAELASHAAPNGKAADLAHYLARKEIAQPKFTSDSEVPPRKNESRNPRQIPLNLRKALLRNAVCHFRDPRTGKTCNSRRYLQIDHIHAVSDGGTRMPENLRPLCGAHNRYRFAPPAEI